MILKIDQEFLDSGDASGTTATMCIVQKPAEGSTQHHLRIINVGDSRVLLGNHDGTIIDGGGTDKGIPVRGRKQLFNVLPMDLKFLTHPI